MPRIPIIPPPEDGEGGYGTGGGAEALAPEQAAALRALQARTARIDRELAFSQSWLASVERLGEAEAAPEGPPPGFTRSFLEETDRDRADLLKTLPPGRRSDLEQDLLGLREEFADRASDVEASGLALRRRFGLHRTLEGYRAGVARDPGLYDRAAMRMEALVADLDLPDDRREPMRLHVKDALGNAALDGLMGEPERAARVLSAGLYDDALTEASKAVRLREAEGLVAHKRLLARERTLTELTARADEGATSDDAIAAAETGGRLTAAEADQLRQRNAEAAQASALRDARIQRVASTFEPLDPASSEDRAAVSDYWDRVSEAYASDDPAAQQKAELAFVRRVGVLPAALGRKYQGALLSDDASVAVQGAEAIDALAKIDPALLDGMPQERVRRAQAVAQYVALDLPPERVIALAEKDIEQNTERARPLIVASDSELSIQRAAPIETGAGTGAIQLATDSRSQRPGAYGHGPSWDELEALGGILAQEGNDAFVEAAEAAGLHPGRARLFLDLLTAKPEDEDRLLNLVSESYGSGYGLVVSLEVKNVLRRGGDPDKRKELLKARLPDLALDAFQSNQDIVDLSMEFPGASGGMAGRAKGSGKPAPRTTVGSLRPGPGFKPNRNFITPEEFRKLPGKGKIDPQRVRTSQDSFSNRFKEEEIAGKGKVQRTVDELAAQAKAGTDKDVPPIRLVEWKGFIYSPDHRRLVAYRRAEKDVRYEKNSYENLNEDAQKRIRNAAQINDNGSFVRNRDTNLME